jgi:N-acetylglucosaminyl-diphospho-decaprenol L-rhamnosyltransferase
MNLSVVTVTFNSAHCIAAFLASVAQHLNGAEVIVVDNDSRDGTADRIASSDATVRVIQNGGNVGFARACNAGADASTRTHILFLNPDVAVAAVDRGELERLLLTRPFGLVAPMLVTRAGNRQRIEHDYPEPPWVSDYFQNTLHALRPDELPVPRRRFARRGVPKWAGGAMLLVERKEFQALGGFDPRFFLYYEDRDLSARYRRKGLPIRTTNALTGMHALGGSTGNDSLRIEPMVWQFLGWLQYVYIWHGARAAHRSSQVAISTLRGMCFGLEILRRAARGSGRLERKSEQVDAVLAALRAKVGEPPHDEGAFCPDALELVRTSLAGGRSR